MVFIDFKVLDLIFVLFELFVGFGLVVQMRKDFVVYSEFEGFSLLDYIEGVTIQSERVLERSVGREFVIEQDFAIDSNFDFARDQREIKYDGMLSSVHGDFPGESFFAGLDMLAHLLNIETKRNDVIGHFESEKGREFECKYKNSNKRIMNDW